MTSDRAMNALKKPLRSPTYEPQEGTIISSVPVGILRMNRLLVALHGMERLVKCCIY
jgi:hypothetical protein